MMTEEFLKVSHVSKSFSGVKALQDINLSVNRGENLCLVGENGSGKSTLIKVIAGVHEPDAGEIIIAGKHFKKIHPIEAIHEGIQVIYQDFSLFPNLSVAENLALNHELSKNRKFVNWREVNQIAQEAIDRIGVNFDLTAKVGQLSIADRQLIAISRALRQNAKLIIMDEPTTALTQKEVKTLFQIIRNLQNDGISTLFVSHKLNEVIEISDRTIVLRNGELIVDAPAKEFDRKKMVYYMTGKEITPKSHDYTLSPEKEESLLKVENLSLKGNFADISFDLKAGEILGITGLLGSGRTGLALSLFGMWPAESGDIFMNGKKIKVNNVQDAINHGIGYVPEDRLKEGLFLEQSISRNIIVRIMNELLGKNKLISTAKLDENVGDWVKKLSIKTASPALPVRSLSGGNQQRVVIAKWLACQPKVLILNGPTVGVDIGSKSELHEVLRTLAKEGMGLVVISDDIPELMQTCNRILLMKNGRIVEGFDRKDITEDELSVKLAEE